MNFLIQERISRDDLLLCSIKSSDLMEAANLVIQYGSLDSQLDRLDNYLNRNRTTIEDQIFSELKTAFYKCVRVNAFSVAKLGRKLKDVSLGSIDLRKLGYKSSLGFDLSDPHNFHPFLFDLIDTVPSLLYHMSMMEALKEGGKIMYLPLKKEKEGKVKDPTSSNDEDFAFFPFIVENNQPYKDWLVTISKDSFNMVTVMTNSGQVTPISFSIHTWELYVFLAAFASNPVYVERHNIADAKGYELVNFFRNTAPNYKSIMIPTYRRDSVKESSKKKKPSDGGMLGYFNDILLNPANILSSDSVLSLDSTLMEERVRSALEFAVYPDACDVIPHPLTNYMKMDKTIDHSLLGCYDFTYSLK